MFHYSVDSSPPGPHKSTSHRNFRRCLRSVCDLSSMDKPSVEFSRNWVWEFVIKFVSARSSFVKIGTLTVTLFCTWGRLWICAHTFLDYWPIRVKYGTGYLHVMSFSICVFRGNRCGESHTLPKGVSEIPPTPLFSASLLSDLDKRWHRRCWQNCIEQLWGSWELKHGNSYFPCGKSCPYIRYEGK